MAVRSDECYRANVSRTLADATGGDEGHAADADAAADRHVGGDERTRLRPRLHRQTSLRGRRFKRLLIVR
jgi:hypothetical protein